MSRQSDRWQAWGRVQAEAGKLEHPVESVACEAVDGALAVSVVRRTGEIHHTVRWSTGGWQKWRRISPRTAGDGTRIGTITAVHLGRIPGAPGRGIGRRSCGHTTGRLRH